MTKAIIGESVMGTVAPRLEELESRACSLEELQAALVQLIKITNANAKATEAEISNLERTKANEPWRATI